MKAYKLCKGINKAKDYPGCGQEVPSNTRKYGLCRTCFREWVKSTSEGFEWFRTNQIKPREEKAYKKEIKKRKIEATNWKTKLQTKVQEIARLIDKGQLCLARQIHAKQMHGGHVYSKGGHQQMRFNLHNIHRQSAYSNTFKNDDDLMKEGIEREYGKEYLNFIKSLKKGKVPKYTNKEYHNFYKKACEIANELKNKNFEYSNFERVILRNTINTDLGIYPLESCAVLNKKLSE